MRAPRWQVLAWALLAACSRDTSLGALGCDDPSDCSPPATICGADGRCVPGCVAVPDGCVAGASCIAETGECAGGLVGASCVDDHGCDPPDLVCRPSSHSCVAGCTLGGACASGARCDSSTGRCCDETLSSCAPSSSPTEGCVSDAACTSASPGRICVDGACLPRCQPGSCAVPLLCDPATGHCAVPTCARDVDCDSTSFCTSEGRCALLPAPAAVACAGGRALSFRCASEESPAALMSCAGDAGPAGCPYCLDGSCFDAGLCTAAAGCHREASCQLGLCRSDAGACTSEVSIASVIAGRYGAGKQVCVSGRVKSIRSGYDGMIELKIESGAFLFADLPQMYRLAGVTVPSVGEQVRAHGTVRWDASHGDWELSPVDWIGP